jgi:hypothetical protein
MPKCAKCGVFILPDRMKDHAAKCQGPAVPKALDGNAPITSLYKKNSGSTWPMDRWVPGYLEVIKKLNGSRDGSFNDLSCTEDTVKRLVTALSYVEKEGLLSSTVANNWKISQFMALSEAFQLQVINNIWNECTTPKTYDALAADMVETDGAVAAETEQLPSSIHPNQAKTGLPYVKGPTRLPFTTLGIGFRVDGTLNGKQSIDSIPGIQNEGMTAQVLNAWFMLNVRHMLVTQTAIALDTSAPRIYARAQDLFNETAVCVARSLFGATAFPERTTEDKACLWAVDTTGLRGFDTEKHQVDKKAKPWRPGEKCFERIPPKNVVGYVVMDRLNGDEGGRGGWNFSIPKGTTWTYLNAPTGAKKDYCEAELAAWADGTTHRVSGAYDFVELNRCAVVRLLEPG